MKLKMVAALDKVGPVEPPRRIQLDESQVDQRELCDFVSHNTRKLFVMLAIPQDFHKEDSSIWVNIDTYLAGQKKVKALKVVNDAAERGIALITSFNNVLTNQEDQKQFLLQIVEQHRQTFPNSMKNIIIRASTSKE